MRDRTVSGPLQLFRATFLFHSPFKLLALVVLSFLLAAILPAQTQTPAQTPYLFVSTPVTSSQDGMVTLLRDPHSGVLTLLPAPISTFAHPCIPDAMEPRGQFLFGICSDGLAMYSFNSTSGAIQEIPSSPFNASVVSGTYSFLVAPESTGQFVYLLKFSEPTPGAVTYRLDKFQIDRATPQLIPLSSQVLPFGSSMVGAAADPNGHGIAVVITQPDPVTSGTSLSAAFFITFDPTTGEEMIPSNGTVVPGTTLTSFALSSQGKYLAVGSTTIGFNLSQISYTTLFTLSTNTFAIAGAPQTLTSPGPGTPSTQPLYLNFDPLGGLLYIQYANSPQPPNGLSPFEIYQVPALAHIGTLLFEQGNSAFGGIPDSDATYRYEPITGPPSQQGLAVWVIDPGTGFPMQPLSLTNPFFPSMNLNPIFANYVAAGGGQNLTGPFLSLSTGTVTFAATTTGQSSTPQTVTFTSAGGQPVSLASIVISGANSSDFMLSGSCLTMALLQPQTSCPLSIMYSPAKAGNGSAIVTITGNSPTSPQTISLSGIAVAPPAPAPVATFSTANPFTLPGTTTQGTSSAPQTITISNTGNAPLHISTVILGGFNSSDYFLAPSNCTGAVLSANSNCSVILNFSPLASGFRTGTISVTDDAANSPQVLSIIGNATPAASINAATGSSTSVSVSAGQTAQFNLTASPGAGFNGTITFVCSGVPFGATCAAPSITVANGVVTPFTVSVTTASAGSFIPMPTTPPVFWGTPRLPVFLLWLAIVLALLLAHRVRMKMPRLLQCAVSALLVALLISSGIGCGGGGSASIQPQPQTQAAAMPSIMPAGGTFSTGYPSVTITDTTPSATIHYTMDGSTPTASSAAYSAPFTLNSAGTVQAIATATGYTTSPVATASFKIQTAAGNYTITITPTATATGSSKPLQMNPISLTLTVK